MSRALKEIENYKRNKMRDMLSQCSKDQIDIFNRMYTSVDDIPESKMDWAFQQIERTLSK